jgi:AraC family transcriptional regulator of adaptative response / DNA-3-methyladenine glycosylase II
MLLDHDAGYRALLTRDARFDGRLFVGVRTTGIYCRPICPARTPLAKNVQFYLTAAAAQEAGFRPCLRCRPECSPDLGAWRGTSNTVSRALALLDEGALDEGSVADLAGRVGVGERQLRRLFARHLGASPLAVAQTRRVLFASALIAETRLSMTEIALAAGFGSVRRFHATFQQLHRRPPRELRRRQGKDRPAAAGLTLLLPYAAPYDWEGTLAVLASRARPGVEIIEGQARYRRTISLGGQTGTVRVVHCPERRGLEATIQFPAVTALAAIVTRLRRVFDLGADPAAIGAHLSQDPRLRPLVAARPGLRVPGDWDSPPDPDIFSDHEPLPTLIDARGRRLFGAELLREAEAWRPWRAYAALHLRASEITPGETPHVLAA